MRYGRREKRLWKNRQVDGHWRRGGFKQPQRQSTVLDEFHFHCVDEVFKRWPDELWAAKGKPRLWVKVHDKGEVQAWRDVAYGGIKLRTPDGVSEGKNVASVNGTVAVCRRGTLEVYVTSAVHVPRVTQPEKMEEVSPEEDTLDLYIDAEVTVLDSKAESPRGNL